MASACNSGSDGADTARAGASNCKALIAISKKFVFCVSGTPLVATASGVSRQSVFIALIEISLLFVTISLLIIFPEINRY